MGSADDSSAQIADKAAERLNEIKRTGISKAAAERYIDAENIDITKASDDIRQDIARDLSDEEVDSLICEYKYGGNVTINYHVIMGMNSNALSTVADRCRDRIDRKEDIEGFHEPYFANSEEINNRLYVSFGYLVPQTSTDPSTGYENEKISTGRCVVVISDEENLIEVRGSNDTACRKARDKIAESIGINREENVYRPDFSATFQDELEESIEKYYHMQIRVDEEEGSTVDSVSYTASTDSSGKRKDAREDPRVKRDLNSHGGEVMMGYVELKGDLKFHLNRKASRLSFMRDEREQVLNEITGLIHNVLRRTGGYKQRQLEQLQHVPE